MARFFQLLILLVDVLNALLAFILLQLLGQRAVKPQGIINKLIVSVSSAIAYFILLFVFLIFISFAIDNLAIFSLVSFAILGIITFCFIFLYKHKTKTPDNKQSVSRDNFAHKAVNQNNPTEPVINNNNFEKNTTSVDEVAKNENIDWTKEFIQKIEKWKNTAENIDPMLEEAINVVVGAGQVSTSLLQRSLMISYARAGKLIDTMEQMGIVGPHAGFESRKVFITKQQWIELKGICNITFVTDNNAKQQDTVHESAYEKTPQYSAKYHNDFIENAIAEQKLEEYERLLNEFIEYAREYINYFFQLEDMSVSVSNIYANRHYKTVTAELELANNIRIGQVKYRLGSLAKYLNVKYVVIANDVTDLSKLGIEISYPYYLINYPQ